MYFTLSWKLLAVAAVAIAELACLIHSKHCIMHAILIKLSRQHSGVAMIIFPTL